MEPSPLTRVSPGVTSAYRNPLQEAAFIAEETGVPAPVLATSVVLVSRTIVAKSRGTVRPRGCQQKHLNEKSRKHQFSLFASSSLVNLSLVQSAARTQRRRADDAVGKPRSNALACQWSIEVRFLRLRSFRACCMQIIQ